MREASHRPLPPLARRSGETARALRTHESHPAHRLAACARRGRASVEPHRRPVLFTQSYGGGDAPTCPLGERRPAEGVWRSLSGGAEVDTRQPVNPRLTFRRDPDKTTTLR